MKLFTIFVLLSVLVARSIQADSKAVEEEIRKSIATWIDANNRGDDTTANQIWAADVQGWFPKADVFRRSAAFSGVNADSLQQARSTYSVDIQEVLVSSDLAVVRDVWRETLHSPKDSRTASRTIWSYEVWKPQTDGKWKIARWISAPEPWEIAK